MEIITEKIFLHQGDCVIILETVPENSVDAVVCDPPYELGFMGRHWDKAGIAFDPSTWAAVMRVLKPGGHLVAFGAPKNYHRLACAIEDAGFEIRDSLMWVFGSGFPKSLDVSKAIDKAAGAERDVVGVAGKSGSSRSCMAGDFVGGEYMKTVPATDEAKQWQGWGTSLKPAYEPIVLARKPLSESTVAANVLRWGTGALNINATRVGNTKQVPASLAKTANSVYGKGFGGYCQTGNESGHDPNIGRWPANLVHDGSEEVLAGFPQSKGQQGDVRGTEKSHTGDENTNCYGEYGRVPFSKRNDEGSAARFFYCAKANKTDRAGSKHPTIKPVALMRWLCRMVTPPGGTILDPFAGSGTTGLAAQLEDFHAILIEREAEYVSDIKNRFAKGN